MVNLWALGGLSWRELLWRTCRESWDDEVFGQAARLAFYHFIALFPVLLLAIVLLSRLGETGSHLLDALQTSLRTLLPDRAGAAVHEVMREIVTRARGTIWFASLGSLWAAFNGTWAVMAGLNDAYEVHEERPWWKVTLVAGGLTLALAALSFSAMLMLFYGQHFGGRAGLGWHIVHWPILTAMLLIAFALYYRFGPDLHSVHWRWSTPGAVVAAVLWISASLLFRAYVQFAMDKYNVVYGSMASAAILLLWFYFTGAAILIGGEVNSEIENAAAQQGHPDARRPGEHRPGGRPAPR